MAVAKGLGASKSLTEVTVFFEWCKGVGDAGMTGLGQDFGALTSLASLDVDLNCCNVGDAGLTGLGQGLGASKSLAKLHLAFRECDIGDAGVAGLAQGLGALKSLTIAELLFDHKKFSAVGRDGVIGILANMVKNEGEH